MAGDEMICAWGFEIYMNLSRRKVRRLWSSSVNHSVSEMQGFSDSILNTDERGIAFALCQPQRVCQYESRETVVSNDLLTIGYFIRRPYQIVSRTQLRASF